MDEKLFKVGFEKRKKVLGKEYVENVMTSTTDLNDTFQKAMTEWCWGFGWGEYHNSVADEAYFGAAFDDAIEDITTCDGTDFGNLEGFANLC